MTNYEKHCEMCRLLRATAEIKTTERSYYQVTTWPGTFQVVIISTKHSRPDESRRMRMINKLRSVCGHDIEYEEAPDAEEHYWVKVKDNS